MRVLSGIPPRRIHSIFQLGTALAAIIAVISLANGGVLSYNTIKSDVKTGTKVKQFIWAALGIVYVVFIVMMQLYCFWKL